MKILKIILLQAVALCAVQPLCAAERAEELLARMAAEFRALKNYEVSFAIDAGETNLNGSYAVAGENYMLAFHRAEVYCDGSVRYAVDTERREVTIEQVDSSSRNLLNNPVHAFEFLGDEYAASLLWEREGKAAILLTPTVKNAVAGSTITVTLATATARPESVVYNFDGEQVHIAIRAIRAAAAPVKRFDRANFPGYELIDFR